MILTFAIYKTNLGQNPSSEMKGNAYKAYSFIWKSEIDDFYSKLFLFIHLNWSWKFFVCFSCPYIQSGQCQLLSCHIQTFPTSCHKTILIFSLSNAGLNRNLLAKFAGRRNFNDLSTSYPLSDTFLRSSPSNKP